MHDILQKVDRYFIATWLQIASRTLTHMTTLFALYCFLLVDSCVPAPSILPFSIRKTIELQTNTVTKSSQTRLFRKRTVKQFYPGALQVCSNFSVASAIFLYCFTVFLRHQLFSVTEQFLLFQQNMVNVAVQIEALGFSVNLLAGISVCTGSLGVLEYITTLLGK